MNSFSDILYLKSYTILHFFGSSSGAATINNETDNCQCIKTIWSGIHQIKPLFFLCSQHRILHIWCIWVSVKWGDWLRAERPAIDSEQEQLYLFSPPRPDGLLEPTPHLPPPPHTHITNAQIPEVKRPGSRTDRFFPLISGPVKLYLHILHTPSRRDVWAQELVYLLPYSVGIATGYGLDGKISISGKGKLFFLYSTTFKPPLQSLQPLIQWTPGTLSSRVKLPGREAQHWPPSSD
jgi:hypothetical protein